MIEIVKTLPPAQTMRLHRWLESALSSYLRQDVSSYAKGRFQVWLRVEPMLYAPFNTKPAIAITESVWSRLADLIEWAFDYCLATYSGRFAKGIAPHRDAGYADYEAYGLNVNAVSLFNYWESQHTFGYSKSTKEFKPLSEPPTWNALLQPGDVLRFNSKNFHSAEPEANRWNLDFWKRSSTARKAGEKA